MRLTKQSLNPVLVDLDAMKFLNEITSRGARLPMMKALDRSQQVIYLGSFSKLIYPGVRVGFAVADQPVIAARCSLTRWQRSRA